MVWLKIILGNLLFTSAYAFIAVPKGIVNGGMTSLAMVLGKMTGLDVVWLTNSILTLLLLACFIFLGRAYFFSALFSGGCYMLLFAALCSLSYELPVPLFIGVPIAAVMVGLGFYCCITAKSTSVGVDTIAVILHTYHPRFNIAATMYACNVAVLLLGVFTYGWVSVAAGIIFSSIQSMTLQVLLKRHLLAEA